MRDKVLYRGWGGKVAPNTMETFLLGSCSYFETSQSFSIFLRSHISVSVSIQGGVKMSSIDEVLGFFDHKLAWRDQEAEEFLKKVSRQNLDTISVAESLFKGTVVDFGDLSSHSGGGSYAGNSFAVN